MAREYNFLIANDYEHEKVFVEIYFDDKFVALINQENGLNNLEIEFPGEGLVEDLIVRKLPLKTFLELINEAAKILM